MVVDRLSVRPSCRVLPIVLLCIVMTELGQSAVPTGPAPGTMINVYGHRLHIHCVGPQSMKPVVIFEAGGGAFSEDWVAVQDLLAEQVRTCAYDRAGLGWSDPGPVPRTLAQEVFELHALLKAARIPGPFVLVGQSLGALNVRLYTEKYGSEVVGVVLVDPADESSMLFNVSAKRWMKLRDQARGRMIPPPRESGPPSIGYKPEDDFLGDEAQLLYLSRQKNQQPFGDRPLFVLAAGKRISRKRGPDVWQFRWSETAHDDRRFHRKKVIGSIEQYPDKNAARKPWWD